jgi:glycosyltransferase involved in cell wall biosynthesis
MTGLRRSGRQKAGEPKAALRVAYVLGTAVGGTGSHAAMLAQGCLRRGLAISVFGPAQTRRLFLAEPEAEPASCPGPAAAADAIRAAGPADAAGPGAAPDGPAGIAFEPVEIAERPRPVRDVAALLRLRELLARAAPDVVHAHGLRAGAFAALALIQARRHRPALLVTVHNAAPAGRLPGLVYRGLELIVASRADAVTCASGDLVARMRRLGARQAAQALVLAPNLGPPSAQAIEKARADIAADGRPVLLAVGRLAEQKGFGVLLDAAASWQGRDPTPLLAIAGAGPLAGELAARSSAAGLQVAFLGSRDDVPALLAVSDVVVVSSWWEARALIVQEALRAGRAIVATRVGGIPELTGEDAALLVPPGEAGPLAKAVLAVLDDKDLASRLTTAALARAARLPSESEAVAAAIALYARLAGQSRDAG